MMKVSVAVKHLLFLHEEALVALSNGYLNLSAFGKKILPSVEKLCKKEVKLGTIVAALNRMEDKIENAMPVRGSLIVEDIAIKTGLTELTYERTSELKKHVKLLYEGKTLGIDETLFMCNGITEVTFFAYEKFSRLLQQFFKKFKLKFNKAGLVSITVRLAEKCIPTPNHTYAILRSLVMKKISVIDNISTYSELTFIVDEDDMHTAVGAINELLKDQETLSK
jgi:hypothetical protein